MEEPMDMVEIEIEVSSKAADNDGDGESEQCSVNTNGGCFVCFKEVTAATQEGEEDNGGFKKAKVTVQDLYKYLKINWKRIWSDFSPVPEVARGEEDMEELKVILCEDCTSNVDKFKGLLAQLEELKKKVDASVQVVVDKMEELEKDDDGTGTEEDKQFRQGFWRKMEEEDGQDELVRKLRERAIAKVSTAKDEYGLFDSSKLKKLPFHSAESTLSRQTGRGRSSSKSPTRKVGGTLASDEASNRTCRICARTFTSEFKLRSHIFVHLTGEFPFQCPKCPNQFKLKGNYQAHLKTEHNSNSSRDNNMQTRGSVIVTAQAQADDVQMGDDDEEGLSSPGHAEPPPPVKTRKFQAHHNYGKNCFTCKRPFLTIAGLQRHYERGKCAEAQGGNVILVQMPITPSTPMGGQWIDIPNTESLEFICILCGHRFPGQISLREHIKICPVKECPMCGLKCMNGVELSDHMQDEHTARKRMRR